MFADSHVFHSGQAGESGPGNSRFPKSLRFALHFFRFPVFIAIVMAIVSRCIDMHQLGDAGSIVLIVAFAFLCGLVIWLAVKSCSTLPVAGHRGVLLVLLALPFLLVRVVYFVLLELGPSKFNPASGDVGILAGMGLLMEIFIAILFLTARAVIEPIRSADNMRQISADDIEQI